MKKNVFLIPLLSVGVFGSACGMDSASFFQSAEYKRAIGSNIQLNRLATRGTVKLATVTNDYLKAQEAGNDDLLKKAIKAMSGILGGVSGGLYLDALAAYCKAQDASVEPDAVKHAFVVAKTGSAVEIQKAVENLTANESQIDSTLATLETQKNELEAKNRTDFNALHSVEDVEKAEKELAKLLKETEQTAEKEKKIVASALKRKEVDMMNANTTKLGTVNDAAARVVIERAGEVALAAAKAAMVEAGKRKRTLTFEGSVDKRVVPATTAVNDLIKADATELTAVTEDDGGGGKRVKLDKNSVVGAFNLVGDMAKATLDLDNAYKEAMELKNAATSAGAAGNTRNVELGNAEAKLREVAAVDGPVDMLTKTGLKAMGIVALGANVDLDAKFNATGTYHHEVATTSKTMSNNVAGVQKDCVDYVRAFFNPSDEMQGAWKSATEATSKCVDINTVVTTAVNDVETVGIDKVKDVVKKSLAFLYTAAAKAAVDLVTAGVTEANSAVGNATGCLEHAVEGVSVAEKDGDENLGTHKLGPTNAKTYADKYKAADKKLKEIEEKIKEFENTLATELVKATPPINEADWKTEATVEGARNAWNTAKAAAAAKYNKLAEAIKTASMSAEEKAKREEKLTAEGVELNRQYTEACRKIKTMLAQSKTIYSTDLDGKGALIYFNIATGADETKKMSVKDAKTVASVVTFLKTLLRKDAEIKAHEESLLPTGPVGALRVRIAANPKAVKVLDTDQTDVTDLHKNLHGANGLAVQMLRGILDKVKTETNLTDANTVGVTAKFAAGAAYDMAGGQTSKALNTKLDLAKREIDAVKLTKNSLAQLLRLLEEMGEGPGGLKCSGDLKNMFTTEVRTALGNMVGAHSKNAVKFCELSYATANKALEDLTTVGVDAENSHIGENAGALSAVTGADFKVVADGTPDADNTLELTVAREAQTKAANAITKIGDLVATSVTYNVREEGEGLAKQLAAAVAAGVVDAPTADLYTDLNNLDAAYTAAMNAARGKKKLLDEAITAFGEVRDGGEALAPEAPVVPVVPVDADAAVVVQLYSDPVRRLADKVVAENRRDAPAADGNDMAKSLKDAGQLLSTLGDSVGGDTTKNADTQSETINVLVSRIRNNLVFLVEREADGNLADPGDGEWQEIVDGFALLRLASRALRNYDYFKQGGNIIPGSDETFRSGDHQDKRCSLVDSVRDDTQFCGQNKVILCEKLSKVTSVAELKNALTIDDDDDDDA